MVPKTLVGKLVGVGAEEPFVAKENGGNNPKRGAERLEGTEAAAKIARRAPPPTGEALCAGDDPLPALEGYVRPLNDSGPTEIEGDPTFLSYEVRSRAWCTLGHAIVAFEDTSAYSVPAGVNFTGLLFWFTRVRSHLASGLGESPEEPGFDPQSARFIYDVRKAIDRCEEVDRLIAGGDLEMIAQGFCLVFTQAFMDLEVVKTNVNKLALKAACARPGALGKVRSRDPHFGKKTIHFHTPAK